MEKTACRFRFDQANRQGIFNGRVVVVKSTDAGDAAAFERQDCLYTLCIRGIENGVPISENVLSTAISRVSSAGRQFVVEILANGAQSVLHNLVQKNETENLTNSSAR